MRPESFDCRYSKILIFLLIIIHVGVLVIIGCALSCLWAQLFFAVLCVMSFIWNVNLQFDVKKLLWNEKTGWQLQDRNGNVFAAKLNRQNICTPWVVGLNFNRKPLIIFFDAMGKDSFRRLRVLLINKALLN